MDDTEQLEEPRLPPVQNEQDFHERLKVLAESDEQIEKAEVALKEIKAKHEALSYSLAQYMMNSSVKNITIHGKLFTQKQKVYSKVEDKEALRKWITDNDAVDVLMAVHPSKLTAFCNERLEAGEDTPTGVNPNFIKYFVHIKG